MIRGRRMIPALAFVVTTTLWPTPPAPGQSGPSVTPNRGATLSLRDAPQGKWLPTLLPPNDLTDPPKNYPDSPGGTCVGICAVTYALWSSPREKGWQSPEGCAVRIIHSLLPDERGRFPNHPLPTHLKLGEELVALEEERALVRLAEIIQNALQPGGGLPKSRETIGQIAAMMDREPARLGTTAELNRQIDRNGGRLILILVDIAPDHSQMSGHAVIVSAEEGRLTVWDPNSKRGAEIEGSGKTAPLEVEAVDGSLRSVAYRATLPDGSAPMRRFRVLIPVSAVVTPDRLRKLPALQ